MDISRDELLEALIEAEAKGMCQFVEKNKPEIMQFTRTGVEAKVASLRGSNLSDDYKHDVEELFAHCMKALSYEGQLEKIRQKYRPSKDIEQDIQKMINFMKMVRMSGPALKSLEELRDLSVARAKDVESYVDELFETAKARGIKYAVSMKHRFSLIRKRFPKPEDYRESSIRRMAEGEDILSKTQQALASDGEAGKLLAPLFGAEQAMLRVLNEAFKSVASKIAEYELEQIYGRHYKAR